MLVLDEDGGRGGAQWWDSGCILKGEPTQFADWLYVGLEGKTEPWDNSELWGWRSRRSWSWYQLRGLPVREAGFAGSIRSSGLHMLLFGDGMPLAASCRSLEFWKVVWAGRQFGGACRSSFDVFHFLSKIGTRSSAESWEGSIES